MDRGDSVAQCGLRQKPPQRPDRPDRAHTAVAQHPQGGKIEQPHQALGHRLHGEHGQRAPPRVALEQDGCADVRDRTARAQNAGERGGVAEAEIHALPGERMHSVRGIAREREPMRDHRRKLEKRERKCGRRRDRAQLAERRASRVGDASGERLRIEGGEIARKRIGR